MSDHQPESLHRPEWLSIEEIVNVLSHRPTATTRERGWDGVTMDVYRVRPNCTGSFPPLDHHTICYCPTGRSRMLQGRGGAMHESMFSAGMSLIIPAGYESTWDGEAPASARLRVTSSLISSVGEQIGRRSTSQIEIRNEFGIRDSVIEHVAQIFMHEIQRKPHPAQYLIADQLSALLATHLLRSYNAFDLPEHYEPPPLSKRDLARITEFIEDNLDRPIGLAEIAGLVNVSRFHFTRLFKKSMGITTSTFVEQCRIRRAQSLISETDTPLAVVALMTGFADQSHFTRRFHRQVGCTPAAFAREHGLRRSRSRSS